DGFGGFQGGVSVGAVEGQTVRLTVDVFDNASSGGGDATVTKASVFAHVKVFNTTTGALLLSRDFTSLSAGLNTIDINRDNLREQGEPNTGRIQLWIEVVTDLRQAPGVMVSAPTLEVFENKSGRTTVSSQKFWHPTDFHFPTD
ncbi:MAG TPA: hypothetical protein VFS77_21100, partial [Pyrinomonadaceae bacterium]|nr:hypothetical protein [Pyrinomonadaceae bacterium]